MNTSATDEGFTLIELLVSIAITTIILGAVTTALIVFYQNGFYTSRRNDHSAGAQLLSGYLDRDLASASSISTTLAFDCVGQPSSSLLLAVTIPEYSSTNASPAPRPQRSYFANYWLTSDPESAVAGSPTPQKVERWTCDAAPGVTTGENVAGSTVLNNVAAASASPPAFVISTSPAGASCPGASNPLRLSLRPFEADVSSTFEYYGCVGGRGQ